MFKSSAFVFRLLLGLSAAVAAAALPIASLIQAKSEAIPKGLQFSGKLGQGGFGCVAGGTFNGKAVAIKFVAGSVEENKLAKVVSQAKPKKQGLLGKVMAKAENLGDKLLGADLNESPEHEVKNLQKFGDCPSVVQLSASFNLKSKEIPVKTGCKVGEGNDEIAAVVTEKLGTSLSRNRFSLIKDPKKFWKLFEDMTQALICIRDPDSTGSTHYAHRDLKPDNILLGSDGTYRLIDFGMTETIAKGEHQCDEFGTPGFMPPMDWDCKNRFLSWDQYSLGKTLLWAVTNQYEDPGLLSRYGSDIKKVYDLLTKEKTNSKQVGLAWAAVLANFQDAEANSKTPGWTFK